MNEGIDGADNCVIVLSPQYLSSENCRHELRRAVARDPHFKNGFVVPVKIEQCTIPRLLSASNPLYADLTVKTDPHAWGLVLAACGIDLGTNAPEWLRARDAVVRSIRRHESVNLIVRGAPAWRQLVEHIRDDFFPEIGVVDLDRGATASRRGLVSEILTVSGVASAPPAEPEDLVFLDQALSSLPRSRVALLHFDRVRSRSYGPDFWKALRFLVMDSKRLVLLLESRAPVGSIIPAEQLDSPIELQTVELQEKP